MKLIRIITLTTLAAALAACSTTPPANAQLDQARSAYREAQADGRTPALAPVELKRAGDTLARAEALFAKREEASQVDQAAYLSNQQTLLALEVAGRKRSEVAVAEAGADSDKLRLAARTREADTATLDAASAQRQLAASQQRTGDVEQRNQALQAQLRELNAKPTDRGMVVTVGDVLFDTGRSELKSGSAHNIQRLGSFLKAYPQRKAMIEGYTDNTGSEPLNLALSTRRAEAVMAELVGMGVGSAQLASQGFGESHPVAGNDNAAGRQMNRRVEIVLSDEGGVLIPR